MTNETEQSAESYVNELDVDALARWCCLIRGIRVVFDKIEEMGDDIDVCLKNKRFFNRVERSVNAYIESQFCTVKSDILLDHQKLVDTFDMDDEEL